MKKLTLEHLAPYLPYKLQILNGWGDIKTLNYSHLDDEGNGFINHVKPFLRPLSDLTKEIEHNGEVFVPIKYNAFKLSLDNLIEFQNGFAHYKSVKYGIIERLLEWHFDVFGLIDKGLAIDKTKVKEETKRR